MRDMCASATKRAMSSVSVLWKIWYYFYKYFFYKKTHHMPEVGGGIMAAGLGGRGSVVAVSALGSAMATPFRR